MYIKDKVETLDIQYNEKDIVSLIRSSNLEDEYGKQVFSVYTGSLLTKLTEARHAEGKTTRIVVDGVNQDYILAETKKADSILITNCEGNHIGQGIGAEGNVGQVIINNCKGDYMGEMGYNGYINQVIINDSEGIARQGLTELIQLVDSLTGKDYQEVQAIAKKIAEY